MPVNPYSHSPKRTKSEAGNPRLTFLVIALLILIGAGVFLATRTIAAPEHKIEKVIGNEHFLK